MEEQEDLVSLGGRAISDSIQALRKDEFELLLSLVSKREISEKVRNALWLMFNHGYEVTFASRRAEVSYRHVTNAERKLLTMHNKIMSTYVEKYLYGDTKNA